MNVDVFVEARKGYNLSQSELAAGICTQATLSRFENNGQVPSLKILIKLCDRLNLSLGELFPKVSIQYSEIIEKMNKAEFSLITSEYKETAKILETINIREIEEGNLEVRYHYLKGYSMIYQHRPWADIVFQFDQILLSDTKQDNQIYHLLASTGIGMVYFRNHDTEKAEFYFNKVFQKIYTYPTEKIEDTWRVLHIVYQSGVFYAGIDELEISNALLNYAVTICSDNHVTFYLARAAIQLAKNAIAQGEKKKKILELIYDARAYAKINRNSIALKELQEMEQAVSSKGRD